MGDHDDDQRMHPKPRFLPWLNAGHLLTIGTIVVSVTAVIVRLDAQQGHFVAAMEAQQERLIESFEAQASLLNARIDLVRAELEGQIRANEARISNQDRFVGAEISRIREILEAMRTDRDQPRRQ